MAINQEIISTSWEGQQKSYIEAGLKSLLQQMLGLLEGPLAANSVGSNQLTQELRDVINSIGSKVPNTRTVNNKELSSNIAIGPDDIMVGNQTLADKLDDMDDAIGQGGDTSGLASRITALETSLNRLTGTEDTTQIIDTFNEVIDFLASVNNDETLVGKLQQLQTQINSKANDNAVVKSISVNGQTQSKDSNGNVAIQVQAGEQVSVTTNQDGTFVIHVGETDYTINLNHTHEGIAKLVVDTAANLPDASEMENDTIYGELDDGEIATIYLGGYPFYGGGGTSSGPVLRRPADGATIDMGQTTSGTVSKTINVKGKSLTQALTIQLNSTGYSFGTTQPSGVTRDSSTQLTVTAAAANALNGVDIVVVYTGSDTDENASGTLGITSASPDSIDREATLVANKVTYEDLAGVKLTGTQWLQTDYKPNANTEFVIDMRFELNSKSNTQGSSADIGSKFLDCTDTNNKKFTAYNGQANNYNQFGSRIINFINESSITYGSDYQQLKYNNTPDTAGQAAFLAEHFILSYIKQSSNGVLRAVCGGLTRSCNTSLKTTTMSSPMVICYDSINNKIYEKFNLTIYSFVITENGSEVRHWVPRKRNGVPGLYDTVTHSFISSETSTELVEVN